MAPGDVRSVQPIARAYGSAGSTSAKERRQNAGRDRPTKAADLVIEVLTPWLERSRLRFSDPG